MYTSDMTMIFDILVESLFKVTLNHILINRKVFFWKVKTRCGIHKFCILEKSVPTVSLWVKEEPHWGYLGRKYIVQTKTL